MRKLVTVILMMALASTLAAQTKGTHRGLLVGGSNLSHGVNWMLQLDAKNQPHPLRSQPGVPNAPWIACVKAHRRTRRPFH